MTYKQMDSLVRRLKKVSLAPRRKRGFQPRKKRVAKLTAPVQKAVKRIVQRQEETKYWAVQLMNNTSIDPTIHTPADPISSASGDMYPLVPYPVKGNDEHMRDGRSIVPVKCKVDVVATFNQQGTPPTVGLANVVYLAVYILRSKVKKSWADYLRGTQYTALLDSGNGTSQPFALLAGSPPASNGTTDMSLLEYPIQKSQFTLVKKRIIKLVKNDGFTNTGTGATTTYATSPNTSQTCWRGSFSYRLPRLMYDDTGIEPNPSYPTNNCTFIAFGYARGDELVTLDSPQMVTLSVRNHVWYKDA